MTQGNNNIVTKTNGITDLPATVDSLGLNDYFDGLVEMIETCPTPMTISIQGGWGSGKTSAMNIVKNKLDDQIYIKIDFNTWQYARAAKGALFLPLVMKLNDLLDKKAETIATQSGDYKQRFSSRTQWLKNLVGLVVLGLTEKATGIGSTLTHGLDELKNLTNDKSQIAADYNQFDFLEELRNQLREKIDFIISNTNYEKVLFFVDDLDRLGPEEAVEFLEDLKNFVETKNCVFVLALDQDIVRRGLTKKYGNEIDDEYKKRFFDKLIQLPFSLPQNQYNIRDYVSSIMGNNNAHIDTFVDIIKGFGDVNPRTIKRAFNNMAMYEITLSKKNLDYQPQQLYAMLLLQINHDKLYSELVEIIDKTRDVYEYYRFFGHEEFENAMNGWFHKPSDDEKTKEIKQTLMDTFTENNQIVYDNMVKLIDATMMTNMSFDSTSQKIQVTTNVVADYLNFLGFKEDGIYRSPIPSETNQKISIDIRKLAGKGDEQHLNINILSDSQLIHDEVDRKEFIIKMIGRGYKVYTNNVDSNKPDEMDVIYNNLGKCVLRNVSLENRTDTIVLGKLLRRIAKTGKLVE